MYNFTILGMIQHKYTLFSDHTLSVQFMDNLEDQNLFAGPFQKISCPKVELALCSETVFSLYINK